ncbi:Tn3 family transposase (plasmid) [Mesorhizobium sp. NBSH29]|nr:Tn3 family transposase [Mesorhizobium sp. NBSH29]
MAEGVHPERLRQLAREGARLTAQHLAALSVSRRRAVLVATVLDTAVRLTDDAVGLFDRLMGRVFLRAERREEAALIRDRRAINDKIRLLARLGDALIAAKDSGSDPIAAVGRVIAWEDLAASIAEAKRLVRTDGPDRAAIVARGHAVVRAVGPRLFDSLTFRSLPASARVLAGIETLRRYYASGRRSWPKDAALGFVPRTWRATVMSKDGIDRRAYEVCLFDELRSRLRAGDVWVEGSRQYRAIEDQLLPKALFAAMREAGPLPVAVSGTARDYLEKRSALLARRMDEVANKATRSKLEEVLYRTLPAVRITDLMADVDRWTGFSEAFTHLHTGLPADERRIVMTAVLADATNLGLTRMADACSVASYRQLAWTTGWHLREETYRRALARIVDGQQAQPLARLFGAGFSSSSDGQHFHVGGPGEAVGAVNRHHGREPTVGFYTHITDRYAPFHTAVLTGSAGEAAHVIDGLLYHEADLDLAVHHTDGGGVSDHVFGLAHILGFRFAPRIPNIGDRKLHVMDKPERWSALGSLIGGRNRRRADRSALG